MSTSQKVMVAERCIAFASQRPSGRRYLAVLSVLSALNLSACQSPAPPQTPSQATTASAAPSTVLLAFRGNLLTPAGLVAQGGANLVAQGGANLVAQGGANLVAQGGANFTLAESFHLLQEQLTPLEQKPLAGVEIFVADASGKPERLAGSAEAIARTDANGQFELAWQNTAPAMLIARLQNAKGEAVFWRTVAKSATKDAAATSFDAASACVTIAAFKDRTAVPANFSLAEFASASDALRPRLYAGKTPKWSDQNAILSFMATQEQQVPALGTALTNLRQSLTTP